MNQLFNPDKKFTQSDIAELLGISDRQVRNLIQQGILPAAKGRGGMDPLVCNHAYNAYLRQSKSADQKAETDKKNDPQHYEQRKRELELDKLDETVAMMRAKRLTFEKFYAPVEIIPDVIGQVASQIRSRLDSLIPKMKKSWLDMPPEAVSVLEEEIIAVCNECADVQPDLSDYIDSDPEIGSSWFNSVEEDATS
ncbi:helix-turn-helix domain-containing protein [Vibrio sp. H11]|uniref:helix-turn-helix domain-containing protein n=1 Tax=Vibrio sp. H11 TaxID=2565928 RepID=UPI0010A69D51|nr:helix-turn-helix domain-containing protein [Vibrio sp. H11]